MAFAYFRILQIGVLLAIPQRLEDCHELMLMPFFSNVVFQSQTVTMLALKKQDELLLKSHFKRDGDGNCWQVFFCVNRKGWEG